MVPIFFDSCASFYGPAAANTYKSIYTGKRTSIKDFVLRIRLVRFCFVWISFIIYVVGLFSYSCLKSFFVVCTHVSVCYYRHVRRISHINNGIFWHILGASYRISIRNDFVNSIACRHMALLVVFTRFTSLISMFGNSCRASAPVGLQRCRRARPLWYQLVGLSVRQRPQVCDAGGNTGVPGVSRMTTSRAFLWICLSFVLYRPYPHEKWHAPLVPKLWSDGLSSTASSLEMWYRGDHVR